jgi:hypothetical protein
MLVRPYNSAYWEIYRDNYSYLIQELQVHYNWYIYVYKQGPYILLYYVMTHLFGIQ